MADTGWSSSARWHLAEQQATRVENEEKIRWIAVVELRFASPA